MNMNSETAVKVSKTPGKQSLRWRIFVIVIVLINLAVIVPIVGFFVWIHVSAEADLRRVKKFYCSLSQPSILELQMSKARGRDFSREMMYHYSTTAPLSETSQIMERNFESQGMVVTRPTEGAFCAYESEQNIEVCVFTNANQVAPVSVEARIRK